MKSIIIKIVETFLRVIPSSIALKIGLGRTKISRHLPANIETQIDYYYGNFCVNINTKYPIEREMISGKYSPDITNTFESVINQGDICFDIGANVGALTLVMSKLTGTSGIVYSFEPNQIVFNRLLENIEMNKLKNVIPIKLGLGEKNENMGLYISNEDPGNAGLTKGLIYDELIQVTSLDSFVDSNSIDKIDLIKVDVEGMEYSVFLGGQKSLRIHKPTIIFETLKNRRERRPQVYEDLEIFLQRLGYLLFRIESDDTYTKTSIKETSEDTLAIHQDRKLILRKINQL